VPGPNWQSIQIRKHKNFFRFLNYVSSIIWSKCSSPGLFLKEVGAGFCEDMQTAEYFLVDKSTDKCCWKTPIPSTTTTPHQA
jgi:hypothetical protein